MNGFLQAISSQNDNIHYIIDHSINVFIKHIHLSVLLHLVYTGGLKVCSKRLTSEVIRYRVLYADNLVSVTINLWLVFSRDYVWISHKNILYSQD